MSSQFSFFFLFFQELDIVSILKFRLLTSLNIFLVSVTFVFNSVNRWQKEVHTGYMY